MSADFSVRVTGFPAVPLITVQGELDLATAGRLDDALRTAGEDGTLITVDLSGVDYLDSAAVKVLFRHAARVKLTLMLPANGTVAPVVDVCGLSRAATVRISSPLSCPVPSIRTSSALRSWGCRSRGSSSCARGRPAEQRHEDVRERADADRVEQGADADRAANRRGAGSGGGACCHHVKIGLIAIGPPSAPLAFIFLGRTCLGASRSRCLARRTRP